MSFSVQTSVTPALNDMPLFVQEGEGADTQESLDSSMPEAPGNLKGDAKQYTLSQRSDAPFAKEALRYMMQLGFSVGNGLLQAQKPSFMSMTMATAYRSGTSFSLRGEGKSAPTHAQTLEQSGAKAQANSSTLSRQESNPLSPLRAASKQAEVPQTGISKNTPTTPQKTAGQSTESRQDVREGRKEGKEASSSLAARKWTTEESREWWETRYHQRERQGGNQQQRDQQQEGHDQEENPIRVTKGGRMASKNSSSPTIAKETTTGKRKPELTPPKVGVFALYYILTKMGIYSDGTSNFSNKKEIELVDRDSTEVHKKRLDSLRESINKEQESSRWGVAMTVFSWIGSITGIFVGAVLIATGVGAVAGSMLIVGGLIQITNQILQLTGGWNKIAELLPGDDSEKKGAIVAWMQLGVAVLCLILAGVGAIWGGYANFGEAMQNTMGIMGGIAGMGQGITTIGQGVNAFMFKNKIGDVKQYELQLARLKHTRKDLMEKVELGIDRLEQLFEDLSRALEFDEELFYADQMLYRR